MGAPVFSQDDYAAQMKALLPRGRVWPFGLDTVISATIKGLAGSFARVSQRADDLLGETLPFAVDELLPEWEATLGLPDPCQGPAPTVVQRRQQVIARFAKSGGQTTAYFIDLALQLGYVITITQFTPFRVGMTVGLPLYGEAWAYAWQVNAALYNLQYFRVGLNSVGDPLATFGNAVLECELTRVKPAHTILIFSYS